ncbi:MAG: AAA family ATPase [Bacteroidaceae bacterium]|nr:AAA family ATPase [Bacteroidaceae bacterium]
MKFEKDQIIDNRYTVVFPQAQDSYSETYRVRDEQRRLHFLTLYNHDLLPADSIDELGEVKVIAMRRCISHPNVCAYEDAGSFDMGQQHFSYIITQFVSCETLEAHLKRLPNMKVEDTRQITLTLLRLLRQLHTLPQPVVHGHISTKSILLDLTGQLTDIRLSGFGLQCKPVTESEIRADLHDVGSLLYRLCFGMEAQHPPRMPNVMPTGMDQQLLAVIAKALNDNGFSSADEMIKSILGTIDIDVTSLEGSSLLGNSAHQNNRPKGNGFADVAGMEELKTLLNESVLYVLRDQERAKRYKLNIPNGMLLYGPPGCGKTFIAERFSEEAKYNYRFVKSSDLASTYIHGTQEKIGMLFEEARANAPTVLCFDEFEAIASKRIEHHNANLSGEVNELLTQLNNCGQDRVFVIATTNQPELIDPAVLRRGRMDHIVYVPMPDSTAREGLFRIHLANRPCSDDINYGRLAALTKDYIASEIAFVCDQAALNASRTNTDIDQELIEQVVRQTKPRTSRETQQYYEKMRKRLENIQDERRSIGFITG